MEETLGQENVNQSERNEIEVEQEKMDSNKEPEQERNDGNEQEQAEEMVPVKGEEGSNELQSQEQISSQQTESKQQDIQNEGKGMEEDHFGSGVDPILVKEQLKYCQRILKGLKRHRDSQPFLHPVDPVALNIPDYFTIITRPMDLSTISKKMDMGEYLNAEGFIGDVRLMLNNCFTYNSPESQVAKMGRSVEKYFNTSMSKMPMTMAGIHAAMSSFLEETSVTSLKRTRTERKASSPALGTQSKSHSGSSLSGQRNRSGGMSFCGGVLRELMKKSNQHLNWPFMFPVDPMALGIPDYFTVIKEPMDLSTIKKKLESGVYVRPEQFESDVRLMFRNCYTFNAADSEVCRLGHELESLFDSKLNAKPSTSRGTSISGPSNVSELVPGWDALESDADKILAINRQIQILQNELNNFLLKRSSSTVGNLQSISSLPSALSTQPHQASISSSTKKNPGRPKTPKASAAGIAASLVEPMTFEEKRQLSEDVNTLEPEKLVKVVEIIQANMPSLRNGNGPESEVIEIDIEALDVKTLRSLQHYIWECKNPKKLKASTATISSNAANLATSANIDHPPRKRSSDTSDDDSSSSDED